MESEILDKKNKINKNFTWWQKLLGMVPGQLICYFVIDLNQKKKRY